MARQNKDHQPQVLVAAKIPWSVMRREMVGWHQWTWVWANSERQWRTGKPGVMQSMGSPRVGHDWATEQQQSHRVMRWLVIQQQLTDTARKSGSSSLLFLIIHHFFSPKILPHCSAWSFSPQPFFRQPFSFYYSSFKACSHIACELADHHWELKMESEYIWKGIFFFSEKHIMQRLIVCARSDGWTCPGEVSPPSITACS